MEVLLLGCGSSVGSPVIGRELDSFDSKNFRTRSSVLITENNKNIETELRREILKKATIYQKQTRAKNKSYYPTPKMGGEAN